MRAAFARPSTTVSAFEIILRPPAVRCAPCDKRGNQAPRSPRASSPRSKAPEQASRQSRRRCLSWLAQTKRAAESRPLALYGFDEPGQCPRPIGRPLAGRLLMRRVADRNEAPIFASHKLAHSALLFRPKFSIASGLVFAPGHGREANTLAPVLPGGSFHSQVILVQRGTFSPIPREGISCLFCAPPRFTVCLTAKIGTQPSRLGGNREPQLMRPLVIRHLGRS